MEPVVNLAYITDVNNIVDRQISTILGKALLDTLHGKVAMEIRWRLREALGINYV